ncbi:4-hydroxy-3-methylbut-2-en-1-yl diphosphate synthase [Verrucomicrobium sp. GAS474]|uniref:(E)-4-hydroxy-3-methylbut-2-enyl-diphosphate synthase n=1 Tax=Verrucomicrobium sp. GAS474 TaxID=1882831 RepID=UPI00087A7EAB|nr:(E)-4-hydroxy-3-methylbut-2-enyl-diphosphate synthase [Verrucomicrobium sp. GAS474]SDU24096.1 4-hydroxy-3-methylbut-2-en-1-yl diphosphate synthase [Verrucomicrobium sp. GAS474]
MKHTPHPYRYQRRLTREVLVGGIGFGAANPIRVQSMITCDTMDTAKSVGQTTDLANAGCSLVRITAPTVKDAANLQNIKAELAAKGINVPIVADIHFKPEAAMEAAKWVDKIRINPGNFADKKKFNVRDYTDEQYAEEIARIEECFEPLVRLCQERKIAMRIGTNHGSLADRLMNRYGDSPQGMVESALEYARAARKFGYNDFVFSMKSSNPKVMIGAYRLLVATLDSLGPDWNYPIHLGVTEAGDGEDGRIKSAIGIGALLADGIGDTLRVSLTEDSIREIPVGRALAAQVAKLAALPPLPDSPALSFDPFTYTRRASKTIKVGDFALGGGETIRVVVPEKNFNLLASANETFGDIAPEIVYEKSGVIEVDLTDAKAFEFLEKEEEPRFVTIKDGTPYAPIAAFRYLAAKIPARHAILLKDTFNPPAEGTQPDPLEALLTAATTIGALLCDGIGDAILVRGEPGAGGALRLSYNILQASGNRIFKTDYVACPSCGRTLFDLQTTTAKIRAATNHLKGVKIAVMGCIVNGPGEMADADFGYVGGAPSKINLYINKTPVKFNIPEAEAVDRLVDLIKENGRWVDPAPTPAKV